MKLKYVDASAVLVALLALGVSGWQLYVQREHNRASTRPLLTIQSELRTIGDKQEFTVTLSNVGLGPAQINSMRIYYDKSPVKDWTAVVESLRKLDANYFAKLQPGSTTTDSLDEEVVTGPVRDSLFGADSSVWIIPSPGQHERREYVGKSPFVISTSLAPRFLGPGNSLKLYMIRLEKQKEASSKDSGLLAIRASQSQLALQVEYTSLYDEKFELCFQKRGCK